MIKDIFKIIKQVRKQGIAVLLVGKNATMAFSIADRAYVLENEKIEIIIEFS